MSQAANARPIDFASGRYKSRWLNQSTGETGILSLSAPSRPLGVFKEPAAEKRKKGAGAQDQWRNATCHCVEMRAIL
jgi:hypothetical protein